MCTVVSADDVTSFIDDVLRTDAVSSTIVVCSSREDLLQALLQDSALPQAGGNGALEPTIRLIRRASSINMVFCPTVHHARAYLSTWTTSTGSTSTGSDGASSRPHATQSGVLGLLNSIHLHRTTAGYSAQAISRTLATAVEAATSKHVKLVIGECSYHGREGLEEAHTVDIWEEKVPILSRNVKAVAVGDGAWMTSTVSIRSIVSRWCKFDTAGHGGLATRSNPVHS